mmetsp:Transcript_13931/g.25701  ORF Transcript_13931/g.25701 Transcript_13931/m.25701 type:complete len:311 (-) Transcript_13931:122-1054(-)
MATKAADNILQDRRTKHVVHSSVNAPAKKGGAGGHYTWGTALSVTDYEPVGVGMTKIGVDTVTTLPVGESGVVWHDRPAPPTLSSEAFPALGSSASPTSMTWTKVPDKVFQAPPPTTPVVATTVRTVPAVGSTTIAAPTVVTAAPATTVSSTKVHARPVAVPAAAPEPWMVVSHNKHGKIVTTPEAVPDPEPFKGPLSADLLREGVPAFDGQHPRNQFARKPNHVPLATTIAAEPAAPAAIDWSSFGTVALQTQVLQANANPAHLSPYVQAKPAPTMQELKAMPPKNTFVPKSYVQPKPQPPRIMQMPRK